MIVSNDSQGTSPLSITNNGYGDIKDAYVSTNEKKEYVITVVLSDDGQEKFSNLTSALAKTGSTIYVIYDGEILNQFTVKEPISAPSFVIPGDFTKEEANIMSMFIRSGALTEKMSVEISEF